jgi:Ni,Fe-hydrogenase I cytochrome b subunit
MVPNRGPWNNFVQANVRKVHYALAYVLLVAFLWHSQTRSPASPTRSA